MPIHEQVARLGAVIARVFYRLERAGERPAAHGPLLAVANHPNSLLDPALVALAVGRPARFLAKAPLFKDALVGWLVRASGAIPVYRQQDAAADGAGGARQSLNDDSLRAAESALLGGEAVALFPEGISHANPALAPLKTGAARLALAVAARAGAAFPVVPVGITLDDRAIFRSRGLLVVGAPIAWDDLAADAARAVRDGGSATEVARVRELTARIERGIAGVTVSYESWEDAHLVALADDVQQAAAAVTTGEFRAPPPERLERRRLGAALLARLRAAGDEAAAARAEVTALGADLRRHDRLLRALRLRPRDLAAATDARTAAGWAGRRLHLLLLAGLAAAGSAIGWVPYQLTGRLATRVPDADAVDVQATAKALVGAVVFLAWTLLLAGLAWWAIAWWAALLTLLVVPPLLVVALVANEGLGAAWRDARRFITLRRRPERVAELRERQHDLARRVEALVSRLEAPGPLGAQELTPTEQTDLRRSAGDS